MSAARLLSRAARITTTAAAVTAALVSAAALLFLLGQALISALFSGHATTPDPGTLLVLAVFPAALAFAITRSRKETDR